MKKYFKLLWEVFRLPKSQLNYKHLLALLPPVILAIAVVIMFAIFQDKKWEQTEIVINGIHASILAGEKAQDVLNKNAKPGMGGNFVISINDKFFTIGIDGVNKYNCRYLARKKIDGALDSNKLTDWGKVDELPLDVKNGVPVVNNATWVRTRSKQSDPRCQSGNTNRIEWIFR